ncbi:hypothetical protein CNBE1050 [Cryptococcus deneoformans B-3501A]|uniref:Respiratory supercomplex factor 1, mitochondrial n=1 Tax=Cryptococcus deneoformans (strain JEC21 / ATCC MYA-565) TaxID=214684 RepID=Q5KH64_CRYD1|nr:hypothetical protein CNE01110 [Cryptococcus neoformans var. neoformans JEC21]XP_775389.1 hypothetical protein CNBE1050 [Cryptococcus neoformans var. neoformans B-3501A]AAW43551.2 hypothetical protein CNE01110 [Cryptococcus neoformans var. neoformans JEC21]EAL20742.1 hypothetical protein CNBE1050 [Cryptococcus neoformans var. neoformans B-3501A]
MAQSASSAEKSRRAAQAQRAYEIQLAGGLQGALRWTVYGAVACLIGHYTWPTFRRQTLGLKAFITSSATICGLVIGADSHLLKHEHGFREAENEIRRKARNSLALEGKIASESEIRKWREKYEKEMSQAKEKETELLGLGSESASVDQGANKEGAVLQALQGEGQLSSSPREKKA